jgi:hypothetical protein
MALPDDTLATKLAFVDEFWPKFDGAVRTCLWPWHAAVSIAHGFGAPHNRGNMSHMTWHTSTRHTSALWVRAGLARVAPLLLSALPASARPLVSHAPRCILEMPESQHQCAQSVRSAALRSSMLMFVRTHARVA